MDVVKILFEKGFIGEHAPLYLDIVGLYFVFLPIFMAFSIALGVKKQIKAHLISQTFLFIFTLMMVVLFEVGMRLEGGFLSYIDENSAYFIPFVLFLALHIIIATLFVILWSYQLIVSIKSYREHLSMPRHKEIGKWIVITMLLSTLMGSTIYFVLFMGVK